VCAKDAAGAPVEGADVQAHFFEAGGPCLFTCQDVTGETDEAGHAELIICGGLELSGTFNGCPIMTSIICSGVQIPYWTECCPAGGDGPFGDDWGMVWVSPDVTQTDPLTVAGVDFAIFASDWLTDHPRSDYNCDGIVGALDFAVFALHWLHNCDSCP